MLSWEKENEAPLPHTSQAQTSQSSWPTLSSPHNQQNYLFIGKHNERQVRQVPRACTSCRRRKIRCDVSKTKAWPCAACVSKKLICVPHNMVHNKHIDIPCLSDLAPDPLQYNSTMPHHADYQHHLAAPYDTTSQSTASTGPITQEIHQYLFQTDARSQQPAYGQPSSQVPARELDPSSSSTSRCVGMAVPPIPTTPTAEHDEPSWDATPVIMLLDALDGLKIDYKGTASYITDLKKSLAETPAYQEDEVELPPLTTPHLTIQIPTEMMPPEGQALEYFEFFFADVYPYCPVIHRAHFYGQWHNARSSISPLLLEAMFACATLMLGRTAEGYRWLALATKHEENFNDAPRLSTLQAKILLLKAREFVPKRGYYWRSWTATVDLVTMAKDLGLHKHLKVHKMGQRCGSTAQDCIVQTRVWQMCFILEVMVGGPQGICDFRVNPNSVDYEAPGATAGHDPSESQVARQLTYYARVARNIHQSMAIWGRFKSRESALAIDQTFIGHDADFAMWLREMPGDMQIVYPPDGSTPWIPSHETANMHIYHFQSVIIHFRPRLQDGRTSLDGLWEQHFSICYTAAKNICRLQEAIISTPGMPGLAGVVRGMDFHIYAGLTCIMVYSDVITYPGLDINVEACGFWARHLSILETCAPTSAIPNMLQRVVRLREAFYAVFTRHSGEK